MWKIRLIALLGGMALEILGPMLVVTSAIMPAGCSQLGLVRGVVVPRWILRGCVHDIVLQFRRMVS